MANTLSAKKVYVFNPGKAPYHCQVVIPALGYLAVTQEVAETLIGTHIILEGDPKFKPMFVESIPVRTL